MANILSHSTKNISHSISNGWTSVLYSTLLISDAQIEDVKPRDDFNWYNKPALSEIGMKCPIHNIFLNQLGNTEKDCCYLCNDM